MPTCLHAYMPTCLHAYILSYAALLLSSNCLLFSSVLGDEQEIVEKRRILLRKGTPKETVVDVDFCRLSQAIRCEFEFEFGDATITNEIVLESVSCGCFELSRDEHRDHVIHGKLKAPLRPGKFEVSALIRIGVDGSYHRTIIKGQASELVVADPNELLFDHHPAEQETLKIVTPFKDVDLRKLEFTLPADSIITEIERSKVSRDECELLLRTNRELLSKSSVVQATIDARHASTKICSIDFAFRNRSRPDWVPSNPVFAVNSVGKLTCKILRRNRPLHNEVVSAFIVDATNRKVLNLAIESTNLGTSSRVLQLSTNENFIDLDENLRKASDNYFLVVEMENKVVLRSSFRVDSRTGF